MSLESINRALVSHDLVQDLKWNANLREEFVKDEAAVLDRYELTRAERTAIEERDFRSLYDLGFHPYLGAQFARILFANNKSGATSAVQHLLASIRREPAPGHADADHA
ncbi:extradiol ring-cleavage dioxygenase [Streptomyces sp. SCA2-2]|uniref:extradiol ring-cleavage dioxygenase n=1 Tax=Streptomyces sp. SCA2-2 TaxID=1563677 RepID=UPI00101F4FB9|nr:extradiol ring-cleavage dioxygenase [Streptomyces sp. SCA2-2]RZF04558.1 extradiol ring-cleavage dioxygenase [Streptomyces sp. SCA2-2]